MSGEYDDCLKRGKIKPFSRGPELAVKELEAAANDLARAQKTFAEGDYKWSTIQLYYSMFHSARTLLYYKRFREHSHYCLASAIRVLYVETKLLPFPLMEAFQQAKELREDADYYNRWSQEGCRKLLDCAKEFLDKAGEIIGNPQSDQAV